MPVCSRRRRNPFGQFGDVGIGRAVGRVMQIVKFADAGEAGLQHLDIGLGRNGFDIFGREAVEEAVHDLAPGPEIVAFRSARLGQPRHAALEGVAVQIGEARNRDGVARVVGLGRDAGFDAQDFSAIQRQPDIIGPAIRQKRRGEPQTRSWSDLGHGQAFDLRAYP